MTDNPFATVESWEVSADTILPPGKHATEVYEIDGEGTSSGGYPQVEIRVGNADGSIRDWITLIPSTLGRFTQFTDACGVRRPGDGEVREDGVGFRLAPSYLNLLVGKRVGTLVRSERKYGDPSQTQERVRGYVPVEKIAASDVPSSVPADPTVVQSSRGPIEFPAATAIADDDIPF